LLTSLGFVVPAKEGDKNVQHGIDHRIETVTEKCMEPTYGPPHLEYEQNEEIATHQRGKLHRRASRG
jgi:hypothetical protein